MMLQKALTWQDLKDIIEEFPQDVLFKPATVFLCQSNTHIGDNTIVAVSTDDISEPVSINNLPSICLESQYTQTAVSYDKWAPIVSDEEAETYQKVLNAYMFQNGAAEIYHWQDINRCAIDMEEDIFKDIARKIDCYRMHHGDNEVTTFVDQLINEYLNDGFIEKRYKEPNND